MKLSHRDAAKCLEYIFEKGKKEFIEKIDNKDKGLQYGGF